MENHFHAIVLAAELSAVKADLKKFTARRLIEQLPREGRDWLLRLLEENRARHKPVSALAGRLPPAGDPREWLAGGMPLLHCNPWR